jgi:hypothetical protein
MRATYPAIPRTTIAVPIVSKPNSPNTNFENMNSKFILIVD